MWAHRITESDRARQLVRAGLAAPADLRRVARGWRRWAEAPDGWLVIVHGEIICRA